MLPQSGRMQQEPISTSLKAPKMQSLDRYSMPTVKISTPNPSSLRSNSVESQSALIGYERTNENKIDGEQQRAGASAQNGWRRGTEANMRRSPKRGGATGVKNGRSLQGKLADGTVVDIEAGASFYTDPSSDVRAQSKDPPCRAGRCTVNLSRAETSSRWCGVLGRGGASSGVVHVT
ncbi:hypothetical protein TNCV_4855261 [Trichonephila clavipes]|nr:hypothetical protein TNCV_4855261 [Trichonephila clavipes]